MEQKHLDAKQRTSLKRKFNELQIVDLEEEDGEIPSVITNKKGSNKTGNFPVNIKKEYSSVDADDYDDHFPHAQEFPGPRSQVNLQENPILKKKQPSTWTPSLKQEFPKFADLEPRASAFTTSQIEFPESKPSTSPSEPDHPFRSISSISPQSLSIPNQPSGSANSRNFIDLSDDLERETYEPLIIYVGRGISMELKEFRGSYYVGLSKQSTANSEIKNRFNFSVDMLKNVYTAAETMLKHLKKNKRSRR